MKNNSSWNYRAVPRLVPSITNKLLLVSAPNVVNYYDNLSTSVTSFIKNTDYVGDLIPLEIAIQIAVSILSPVNIQTLIPAFLTFSKV